MNIQITDINEQTGILTLLVDDKPIKVLVPNPKDDHAGWEGFYEPTDTGEIPVYGLNLATSGHYRG